MRNKIPWGWSEYGQFFPIFLDPRISKKMLRTNKQLRQYVKSILRDEQSGRPIRTMTAFTHQIDQIYSQIAKRQNQTAFIKKYGKVQWDNDEPYTLTKPLYQFPFDLTSTTTKPIKIRTVSPSSTTKRKGTKRKAEQQFDNSDEDDITILRVESNKNKKFKKQQQNQ